MTININTNVASLVAQKSLNATQDKLNSNLEKLASGLRINSAKDDAAGLAISVGLESQMRGLRMGASNGNNGISLIGTAESALNQVLGNLQRMYELSVEAANGTYQTSDIAKLNDEFQLRMGEINRVAATANFNGVDVLTAGTVTIQIGNNNTVNDSVSITLTAANATSLGISTNDLLSTSDASAAIGTLQTALATVSTALASIGASNASIESAVNGNYDTVTELAEAKMRIMEVDFAAESSDLSSNQILQQAGIAMLSQANTSTQSILKLIS